MKKLLLEFFQGEGGLLSMHRLLQFMAFFPATGVLIYIKTTEALSMYLGAFVANGVLNKFADIKGRKNAVTDSKPAKKQL